jgi:tRNA1Val (adenine37-N6)-methyltransferase
MNVSERETVDLILGGGLELIQPRRGYRFSMESVLLARFIRPRARARIIELGAGCGVISLIAAALYQPRELIAVELQPELADLIPRNAARNRLDSVRALTADLRARSIRGLQPASFDYAIANPPFRAAGSGRESPLPGRRIARGGGGANLADFIAAAARYLKSGGTLGVVFVAARAAELIGELRHRRLEPRRMQTIHPAEGRPATAIMIEARKDAGAELVIEPSLIMYAAPGILSTQARAMLEAPLLVRA